MASLQSPLSLNPSAAPVHPTESASTWSNHKMLPTPQPTQLLPAAKIHRIDVWRTEVGTSDIECVCSMGMSPMPLKIFRSPTIHPPAGSISLLTFTTSVRSQTQRSPASSLYSASDLCPSTQATSLLSSNSLGQLLDDKLRICPQCGVRKNESTTCLGDYTPSGAERELVGGLSPTRRRKQGLWFSFKKLVRKGIKRDDPRPPSPPAEINIGKEVAVVHGDPAGVYRGINMPPPRDANPHMPSTMPNDTISQQLEAHPERTAKSVGKQVSQTFKRMSMMHLGSPLQTLPPPDLSQPRCRPSDDAGLAAPTTANTAAIGRGGISGTGSASRVAGTSTQMYSTLIHATADDERLREILGPAKFALFTTQQPPPVPPLPRFIAGEDGEDANVNLEELEREKCESPETRRFRELSERIHKGRRLLSRSGTGAGGSLAVVSKRPISFAGIGGGLGMKF